MTEELMVVDKYSTALEKENITEKVIADLKASYLPLKIADINDKEGYKMVKAARLHTKNLRVMAAKICKAGREDAIAEQKAWIAKENEITSQIKEVENHLEEQEKWFESEKQRLKEEEEARIAAIKAEEERQLQAKIKQRAEALLAYGITGDYDTLKDSSDEEFAEILAQAKERHKAEEARLAEIERQKKLADERYRALYKIGHTYTEDDLGTMPEAEFELLYSGIAEEKNRKDEAEREEKERLAKIAAEQEVERQRLAEQKRQQEEREAAFKAEQEKLAKEQARIAAEKREEEDKRWRSRLSELTGVTWDGHDAIYKDESVISYEGLINLSGDEFHQVAIKHNNRVKADREAAEKEAAEQARLARKATEERRRALQPDRKKIIEYVDGLIAVPLPDLKTEEAKQLFAKAHDSLSKLAVALINESNDLEFKSFSTTK